MLVDDVEVLIFDASIEFRGDRPSKNPISPSYVERLEGALVQLRMVAEAGNLYCLFIEGPEIGILVQEVELCRECLEVCVGYLGVHGNRRGPCFINILFITTKK